jgi:hypothetical protein
MIMKNVFKIITLLSLSLMLTIPTLSQAAETKTKNVIVMKMGSKVHLFHSSEVAAQKEIAVGDVIPVYRQYVKPSVRPKEAPARDEKVVGEVKVLSFIGEHYFEAEVVKGEVKTGDIAKKDTSALLVQPVK